MKASIPKRLLTLRDKDKDKTGSHHRRSKSSEGHRVRPLSTETFRSIFKNGSSATNGDGDKDKENAKMDEVERRLSDMDVHEVSKEYVRFALDSKYAGGDPEKAVEILLLHQQSMNGSIVPYNPDVHMVGAENRSNVTCYLDALLFAMFAKLEAFECMLKNDPTDEAQRKLAVLIRLWVNMLRSGKLIRTDMTQLIQEALAACGWKDAQLLEQQDTSEAFAFITETLQLPLLTLQVDLFHQGKGDKDDHKVVYERLLNLAVPADPDGKGVKLEDCLEDYFNTRVDVSRDGIEEKGDRPNLTPRSTIRIVKDETSTETPKSDQPDGEPLQRHLTAVDSVDSAEGSSTPQLERQTIRHRSTSIIQRIVLDDEGKATDSDPASLLQKARKKSATVVKAVTIPAWQFFRLIRKFNPSLSERYRNSRRQFVYPEAYRYFDEVLTVYLAWHAVPQSEPETDGEILMHFNQRPVVGICLKRYLMTEDGQAKRQNTFIDIPDSLRLPHFMVADDAKVEEDSSLSAEYKLVLQSVVCHRGDSVHSGHYISFARVNPKLLTDNRRHDNDPPPDYEDAQWVKFDDLAFENRVSYVDDIKESLKKEMPYLLFYQIVPMVDVTAASVAGSETEPPSYNDSTINVSSITTDSERPGLSRPASGYFDTRSLATTGPSIRFSSDLERPPRLSLNIEDDGHVASTLLSPDISRRGSIAISEPFTGTPAITPENGPSPAVTPNEESTAQRLSRAAAKFTKSKDRSRPTSQAGESRISITMSRLNLKSKSKEPLREAGEIVVEDGEETPIAVIAPERLSLDGGEAKKEKEHHHHHHLHGHGKKGRAKSKSRGGDKELEKTKSKSEVPDRECVVM